MILKLLYFSKQPDNYNVALLLVQLFMKKNKTIFALSLCYEALK